MMKVVDDPAPVSPEAAPEAASEAARVPRQKARRPYAPPAIESAGGFAPITLGTKAPVMPGQGC